MLWAAPAARSDQFLLYAFDESDESADAVRALEAGVRMGGDAVAARLADRVQGWHALVAEMQRRAPAAQMNNTSAAPFARTNTTRKTMNEDLTAALTAATGETDIEKAVGLLIEKNAAYGRTVEALTVDLGAANTRAQAAEARVARSTAMSRAW